MANNLSLDKKLDDILERLNYLAMVIRNLKDRSGTFITDIGKVDERLFREIANYEMSTEELKRDFVLLLIQDARRLGDMCINNTNIGDSTLEGFDKIDGILNFIMNHEAEDIRKSKELQEFAEKAKIRLGDIRNDTIDRTNKLKEEKKELQDTQRQQRWK